MASTFRRLFPALFALALAGSVFWSGRIARAADDDERWQPDRFNTASVRGEAAAGDSGLDQDGVYGRFDGDLFLSLGAGVELGDGARAGGLARALWFHTAGAQVGYARALSDEDQLGQVLFVGAEIRPLFLPRFVFDLEGAGPFLDLTLDSLALGAGVCFASEADNDDDRTALELSLGVGVPLLMKARGPWLEARAALRPGLTANDGQLFLFVSWYEAVETSLVR